MIKFSLFLFTNLCGLVFLIQFEPTYVRFNGVTIRVQSQPHNLQKRKMSSWVQLYKDIEKRKRAGRPYTPASRATGIGQKRTYGTPASPYLSGRVSAYGQKRSYGTPANPYMTARFPAFSQKRNYGSPPVNQLYTPSYRAAVVGQKRTYRAPVVQRQNNQRVASALNNLRSHLPANRPQIMNYFYNKQIQPVNYYQKLPSLNSLLTQTPLPQMLQMERYKRMYQIQKQRPSLYISQQLDKKDLIRSPYFSQYSYPYYNWQTYSRPNTRSYIPSYYSSSSYLKPQTGYYAPKYNVRTLPAKTIIENNGAKYQTQVKPVIQNQKGSVYQNKAIVQKLGIPLLNQHVVQSKAQTSKMTPNALQQPIPQSSNKQVVQKQAQISQTTKPSNVLLQSPQNAKVQKGINQVASQSKTQKPTISAQFKHHAFHKTNLSSRHHFHKTLNSVKLPSKREYLSAPDTNSFENEEGEFPLEDNEDEPEQEIDNSDPLERDEQLNIARQEQPSPFDLPQIDGQDGRISPQRNLQGIDLPQNVNIQGTEVIRSNAEDQQDSVPQMDTLQSNAQALDKSFSHLPGLPVKARKGVPLLNIDTPDMTGIPNAMKGELEKTSQPFTKQVMMNADPVLETSQKSAKKNDDTSVDEQAEAKKEEQEANKLMGTDLEKLKMLPEIANQNPAERPPMMALPQGNVPTPDRLSMMALSQGNIATPDNGVNMEQAMMGKEHLQPPEEFLNGHYDEHNFNEENPEFSSRHNVDAKTEETINNVEKLDNFDPKKLVKSLSGLSAPPEDIALGGERAQRINDGSESIEYQGDLLDPVKTQERARELQEQFERSKETEKETKGEIQAFSGHSNSKEGIPPEVEMNSLDGKQSLTNYRDEKAKDQHFIKNNSLPTDENASHSEKVTEPTAKKNVTTEGGSTNTSKSIDHPSSKKENLGQQNKTDDAAKPATESSKQDSDKSKPNEEAKTTKSEKSNSTTSSENAKSSTNSKAEVADNIKPTESETPKPDNQQASSGEKSNAAPTISSQVASLIQGISHKHGKVGFTESEEKETKEAVKDLSVAIGILEKKLALINDTKVAENLEKNVSPERKLDKKATGRSDIDLSNSLKVLEKVMNVATRVGKRKKVAVPRDEIEKNQNDEIENDQGDGNEEKRDEIDERQRNVIPRYEDLNETPIDSSTYVTNKDDATDNYEQLEDAKRNHIEYPDTFIMTEKRKRTNIPYPYQNWKRHSIKPYYNIYQEPYPYWNRRTPYFYRYR